MPLKKCLIEVKIQNLEILKKHISLKLLILLSVSCLVLFWNRQSHAQDEFIIAKKDTNAEFSNIKLTAIERDWLNKNQTIKVAVKSGWMPIEFRLESAEHRGISIDYLYKLAGIFNVKFIVVNYTENITSQEVDLISSISNSNLKEAQFKLLRQPFLNFPFAIYTNSSIDRDNKINSLNDLNNLRVAVFKNGNVATKLRDYYPKIKLVYVDIADEAFEELRLGNVDAYIGNELLIDYHITVHRLNFVEKSGNTPFNSNVSMAVRKDLPILASILTKGIVDIGPNNEEILNKWKINDEKNSNLFIRALVLMGGIFLIFLVKVYRIRKVNKNLHIKSQQQIWYQANFDQLTNLPNRHLLKNRLEQAKERADRSKLAIGLLYVDLDDFKKVNDQSGHFVGDKLLQEAANRINKCVRPEDTVARVGGDEFIVVLSDIKVPLNLEKTCQSLLISLNLPFTIDSQIYYISASIGVAVYPDDSHKTEELLNYADQAMFEAKKLGRNRFHFFTQSIQAASHKRLSLANDIRAGILEQQFVLNYQPIIDLKSSKILKAEVLIRWNHPTEGIISPMDFIHLTEEAGLIDDLGNWVFNQAIKELVKIKEHVKNDFQLSINVSPNQFKNPDNLLTWIDTIEELGVSGSSICIEITEGLLLVPSERIINTIFALRDVGFEFSIDDFGTGYSALAYLKKFHMDYVKIDKSFVQNLYVDNYDAILCSAIIDMAHKLGMKVVAEGVETLAQKELLTQFTCDFGQGYLFSKPIPLTQLLEFMSSYKSELICE